ncbi:CmpA/NrtA family ABC transporter substrate-binding protein [Salinisphaera orenii]|uniref:Nitrate ABC transporter substrate-binding protein n=1 Tax=Salinisphaera orenii YIM 95161 TaxID=1051139 RepID=A0A423PTG6_9GAMM|nr:CmpA/NrtA family ABC transporter substrate-binding protein [Salinisphaera halophila]ROO28822.1 nitrate ABC transporter substrate-binding protein [Salinisphaera halophila YIM 95161]
MADDDRNPQRPNRHAPLGDPFDAEVRLHQPHAHDHAATEAGIAGPAAVDRERLVDRLVESTVVRAVFGHRDGARRRFLQAMGGGTAVAALSSVFPLKAAKAAVHQELDDLGGLEKRQLKVGFVPITCATPIIMADPLGFYRKQGLDVEVVKTPGWAVARDKAVSLEHDAAHMLTPMPLAIDMGAGSAPMPFYMPAVENINGQAITLHRDHRERRDPRQWRGFRFAVPFDYSMHNFLLCYYVAEHGLDPDRDIEIRVLPPQDMVANLRRGNVDGYLAPDPFNQRAVHEGVGFIHLLTKEIWDGHPCCAFAASRHMAESMPNTFGALFKAIVDATHYSSDFGHRREIAEAIAPARYLDQPVSVVEQVLTGHFEDGLGGVHNVPDRIDFDPFPWHAMAVWILTQMKRWGYVRGDVDYQGIAERVCLATDCGRVMRDLGYAPPAETRRHYTIMNKRFDSAAPQAYVDSFAIRRASG